MIEIILAECTCKNERTRIEGHGEAAPYVQCVHGRADSLKRPSQRSISSGTLLLPSSCGRIRRRRQRGWEAALRSEDAAERWGGGGALERRIRRRQRGWEPGRWRCARPHHATAARREARTQMKEKMESWPGREVRRRRSHGPRRRKLAGGGGHDGEAALRLGARCLICRSSFLSSPTPPLLHVVVLLPTQQRDQGRCGSWVNRSVARWMRHSLFHLDQQAADGGGKGATTSEQEAGTTTLEPEAAP